MPGNRSQPRSEAGRVAARVRALLDDTGDGPSGRADPAGLWSGAGLGGDGFGGAELGGDALRASVRPPATHASPGAATVWDRVLARVPVRLDPGRRAAVAVGVAVLLAAVITGLWLMSSRPQAVPVSASVPSVPGAQPLVGTDGATEGATDGATQGAAASGSAVSASASPAVRVVVDVAGKVRRPGVYGLPAGSRVVDALDAAGGPVGHVDLSTLNLAAPVVDGQQVAVGVPPAAGGPLPSTAAGGGTAGATATVVDLNTATLEQLETLPGIGPVLGQDILDYRSAHGSFSSVDQLQDVSGIGDAKFGEVKALVSV